MVLRKANAAFDYSGFFQQESYILPTFPLHKAGGSAKKGPFSVPSQIAKTLYVER
jgi:hypothetical protein